MKPLRALLAPMRSGLVAALTLFFPLLCSAQWIEDSVFHAHTRKGIDFVYNLEFENAENEFLQLVSMQPNHPAGHFFLAMVEWWRILIDIDNTANDAKFYRMLENIIALCDKRLKANPDDVTALFFKGGSIGFRGRLRSHREEWIRAANDGRLALPIVQRAYRLAPENYDVLLGMGIYNYYAEVIPDQYPFVKPLMIFVPKGDKKKGIEQLRSASEKAMYADIEATYFLMQLLYNFEKEYPKALPIAQKLHDRFPNNPLFHRYLGRCYAALGMWNDMRQQFGEVLARVQRGHIGYARTAEREAEYYLGLYDMMIHQYDAALKHFMRCDELSQILDKGEQSGFMALANLRIGMIHDLRGRRDQAVSQYRKVLGMKEYSDSRKLARQYLQAPYSQ